MVICNNYGDIGTQIDSTQRSFLEDLQIWFQFHWVKFSFVKGDGTYQLIVA